MADNGPYTTFNKDRVIQAVRVVTTVQPLLLAPLPHNIDLPVAPVGVEDKLDPLLHHNFINAYMNPLAPGSRERILDNVVSTLARLEAPEGDLSQGVITVSFFWNSGAHFEVLQASLYIFGTQWNRSHG